MTVKMEVPDQFAWVVEYILRCYTEKRFGSLTLHFHDGGVMALDNHEKILPPEPKKVLDKEKKNS